MKYNFGIVQTLSPKAQESVSENIQVRLPPAFVSAPLIVTQREPLNCGPSPQ